MQHSLSVLDLQTQKKNQLLAKGLETVEDVAFFFPRKYYDFRRITPVKNVVVGGYYALKGTVVNIQRLKNRIVVSVEERAPKAWYPPKFSVVWFHADFYAKKLSIGHEYIFCGQISEYRGYIQMIAPIAFGKNEKEVCCIIPIYSKIKGMSDNYLRHIIKDSLAYLKTVEISGEKELFAKQLGLMDKFAALSEIHRPTDDEKYKQAMKRADFERIYDFYDELRKRVDYKISPQIKSAVKTDVVRGVIKKLPFTLTKDQNDVMQTIMSEAQSGRRIHSLVSGDVGCGKTIIAILSAIYMWENGYQTIMMAPTLVLAAQHYEEFLHYTAAEGIQIGLLTTATSKKERRLLIQSFKDGSLDILIGTHAVLNDEIEPAQLGLTIVDEEHKFGVKHKKSATCSPTSL